jgi:rhamnosyltransferase
MQSLKVACVIPTYNGFADLQRLLDSLAAQSTAHRPYRDGPFA